MSRRIVLLGPPGAGKGTQAARVAADFAIPHISTGDLFRVEIAAGSELGKKAKGFIDTGDLVPDEIVLDMLAARISEPDVVSGFLLDGFPRTSAQAEALERRFEGGAIDLAVLLEVEEEELVTRLSGRWVCSNPKCSGVFHVLYSPPLVEGICDSCGAALVQRNDDKPEAIRRRLQEYASKTSAVIDFYETRGELVRVDSSGSVEDVASRIESAIDNAIPA